MIDKTSQKREVFFKKRRLGEDETVENQLAWDAIGDEEKFTIAWEMVKQAHLIKGGTLDELRFQRSVAIVGRKKC